MCFQVSSPFPVVYIMETVGRVIDFSGRKESVNQLRSRRGQAQGPSNMFAKELRLKEWGLSHRHISVNLPFIPLSCWE